MCRMPNTSVHWNAFLVPFFFLVLCYCVSMKFRCEFRECGNFRYALRIFFPLNTFLHFSFNVYVDLFATSLSPTHTQARLSLLMTPKRCASSPIETKMQDNGSEIPVFQCEKKKRIASAVWVDDNVQTLWIQIQTMDNRLETIRTKEKPFWNR